MKAPGHDDRFVKVRAFLSDAGFGYENWNARQFGSATCGCEGGNHPAVLIICATAAEQSEAIAFLEARAAARGGK